MPIVRSSLLMKCEFDSCTSPFMSCSHPPTVSSRELRPTINRTPIAFTARPCGSLTPRYAPHRCAHRHSRTGHRDIKPMALS
eukprot:2493754-Rhodomonas_salina.2